jgi:UDP-glucose 4-epimerase
MRIALAGGGGFLGAHIARAILAQGDAVRIISSAPAESALMLGAEVEQLRIAVGTDLTAALHRVDALVDMTGPTVPAVVEESPASALAEGLGTSAWLAERAAAQGVGHLLYCSSGGTVYGRTQGGALLDESSPLQPISCYGALKRSSEIILSTLLERKGTVLTVLRIGNPYGEWQDWRRRQGVIAALFRCLALDEPFNLIGEGAQVRDYVYAGDVGRFVARVARNRTAGTFNVSSGQGETLLSLMERVERVTGRTLRVTRHPGRSFDLERVILDSSRARSTGWQAEVDLDQGLRRTWKWYEQRLSSLA